MTPLGEQTDMGQWEGMVAAVTGGAIGVSDWMLLQPAFQVPARVV